MRSWGGELGLWEARLLREDKRIRRVTMLTSNQAALQDIPASEFPIALAEDSVITAIHSDIWISRNDEKKQAVKPEFCEW